MTQTTTAKKPLIKLLAVLSALMLSRAACGGDGKETSTTLTNDVNGVEMTFTYYADGDDVTRQTTKNVMPYELLGVTTADEAKQILDPMTEEFKGVTGLEHSMEYGDTAATETLTVDYTTADLSEISQLTGSTFSGDTSSGAKVSLEKSIEMLESQGFTKTN